MRRTLLPYLSLASALATSGCLERPFDEAAAWNPDPGTTDPSTSTTEPMTPTTGEPGVQTVTGDEDTTGTSSSEPGSDMGAPANVPPTIVQFDGIPDHIGEAGPVKLHLVASDDVVAVQLSLDDEVLADDLTPADFRARARVPVGRRQRTGAHF